MITLLYQLLYFITRPVLLTVTCLALVILDVLRVATGLTYFNNKFNLVLDFFYNLYDPKSPYFIENKKALGLIFILDVIIVYLVFWRF